ncbi:MAG TPA: ABC transporter permease [Vicinamibacterales bacterium]|nr:ABC transporter permease [Vicinamibacterales bacterium]
MTLLHRILSVTRRLIRPNRAERELDDELQGFIDVSVTDKMRDGIPAAEARRLALLELGGVEQAKERVRTYQYGAWLDEAGRDAKYAWRMFARQPGFTAVVVLTLTLGIGANTAVFSLIDALMLRWLPVRSPHELVQLSISSDENDASVSLSYPIVGALAAQGEIFAGVTGFNTATFDVGTPGAVAKVPGALVTGAYYETLDLDPVIGRLLTPADDRPGAPLVAVLSYGYWVRQFARRPDIVGQSILLNGVVVDIVGVSPRGFVGAEVGAIADVTVPVAALPRLDPPMKALLGPGNFWLRVLARPRTGLSAADAEARFATAWPRISEPVIPAHWPASRRKELADASFRFSPGGTGWTFLRERYATPLFVLMGVAALVMLIACANVASLLLARASARRREIGVRLAIGAGRGRVVRQLMIESTLLSSTGALLGLGFAWLSGRVLVGMISTGPIPVEFDLTPNWHMLGFTTAVAVATAVAFGVAPALYATADGPAPALRVDTRTTASRSRLLPSLVSAQVALSLVLLVGAGLFSRTLHNLQTFDSGFTAADVLVVDLPSPRAAAPQELVEAIQGIPGVVSASVSTHTPLSGSTWSDPVVPAGQPIPDRDTALFVGVGPGFFETMRIPLLSGRSFTIQDSAHSPGIAVVNERFAQRFFPKQNPIGQRLSASVMGQKRDLTIVGLARNVNATSFRVAPPSTVYVAHAQLPGEPGAILEIRAGGPTGPVASAVRERLRSKLPSAPIEVRLLSAQVDATMVQERMMATLSAAFGLLALVLACIGLYGLLAYGVARRVKEMGIRLALGAQRRRVTALVLWSAARLVLVGIAVGLPVAWTASRWIESLLFNLNPRDPAAAAFAVVALAATALLAAYLPARRAARVDPLVALRHE